MHRRHFSALVLFIAAALVFNGMFAVPSAMAQKVSFIGEEPDPADLGAPLYPGSVFVRVMATLDPFYETVFYVSSDPVGDVKNFFRDELPKARMVQYRDEYEWVWVYLLVPHTPFPEKPTRNDLPLLDATPNVMTKKFQDDLHEPLIEYFQSRPELSKRLEALLEAKTLIRYTYRIMEEDIGFRKLRGTWKNVDRGISEFYGSHLEFSADSTYTLSLNDDNIRSLALKIQSKPAFMGKSTEEIVRFLNERNPEKGRFSITRNTIDLVTDKPVVGDKNKSGLIDIQDYNFTVQFINMQKLTFIRENP